MRKEGQRFFLTLLVVSTGLILLMFAFFFKGKEIAIFTFQKFVINKAFVALLPREYTLEEAERIRKRVYTFYDDARTGAVEDKAVLQVSLRIQAIMADDKMTHEEVLSLTDMIAERTPTSR